MSTLLEGLRSIIGAADFYIEGSGYSGTWDYGAMIEYMACVLILCIAISSVFRFLTRWVGK